MFVSILFAAFGAFGAALTVGGVVAYRGSARVRVRALSAGAITAGTIILALVLFIASWAWVVGGMD